jgi:hypothetical protein
VKDPPAVDALREDAADVLRFLRLPDRSAVDVDHMT